jgi:hypothetical protein
MKLKALTTMIRSRNGKPVSRTLFGEATGAEVRCLGVDDDGSPVEINYDVTVATDGSVHLVVRRGPSGTVVHHGIVFTPASTETSPA